MATALKSHESHEHADRGKKVESIALDLGYANASAFINMFKRWMVYTPDQFRKLYHSHQ
jgi:AraC-like DNA-binding protein